MKDVSKFFENKRDSLDEESLFFSFTYVFFYLDSSWNSASAFKAFANTSFHGN